MLPPYLATIVIYDEIQEMASPSYTEASMASTGLSENLKLGKYIYGQKYLFRFSKAEHF